MSEDTSFCGLLHDFGEHWQVEVRDGMFIAIERKQPPVLRFQVAATAEELRGLLEHDREIHQW